MTGPDRTPAPPQATPPVLDNRGSARGADGDYAEWKAWRAEDFGRYARREARYFGWLLQRCHVGPLQEVLEIGFGNGAFLGYCRDRGWRAMGVELLPPLCERARQAGFDAETSMSNLPSGARFDLIAAFDVLEHLPQGELAAWISDLQARLAPGGTLLFRVPNGESVFGRQNQHGDLTHQTTLGLSKFKQLAARCSLEVVWYGDVPRHVTTRGLKNLMRAAVRRMIELTLAFAHDWDANNQGANLVVALRRPNHSLA